jgi:hypothetical protein
LQRCTKCGCQVVMTTNFCTTAPDICGSSVWHLLHDTLLKGKAVPLQAWSDPEGSRKLRFPDFMTTAQDGGKVVSNTHQPPLPPGNAPGTHFCLRMSRPQGHSAIGRILCQRKIPMTPAGIEPATFQCVAQHLNHCATAVPLTTPLCQLKFWGSPYSFGKCVHPWSTELWAHTCMS